MTRWRGEPVAPQDLGSALRGSDNALNGVRLVMAGLVVVGHTWPVGGFGDSPVLGGMPIGWWALAGFFTVSGFLTANSASRLPLLEFLRRRALRIFPGYWLCLALIGVVIAPLAARLAGTGYAPLDGVRYLLTNVTTAMFTNGVGPELDHVPLPGMWDGSIWTLARELGCYVLMGTAATLGLLRRRSTVIVALAIVTVAILCGVAGTETARHTDLVDTLRLLSFYLSGALCWSLRHRLTAARVPALAAAVLAFVLSLNPVTTSLLGIPLAYALLTFGATCPLRLGSRNDLSYGVYLYAWPVQQLAVVAGLAGLGPLVMLVGTVPLVLGLAWLSWMLVEHPALRLSRRAPHRLTAPVSREEPAT